MNINLFCRRDLNFLPKRLIRYNMIICSPRIISNTASLFITTFNMNVFNRFTCKNANHQYFFVIKNKRMWNKRNEPKNNGSTNQQKEYSHLHIIYNKANYSNNDGD